MPQAGNYTASAPSGALAVYGGRSAPLPAWAESMAANSWGGGVGNTLNDVIPSPDPGPDYPSMLKAWNGWTVLGDYVYFGLGGGHGDYFGNQMLRYGPLSSDTPQWALLVAPSASITTDVMYLPDGRPAARHVYGVVAPIPALAGSSNGNRIIWPSISAAAGGGTTRGQRVASYDIGGGAFDAELFFPDSPGDDNSSSSCAWDSVNELLWYSPGNTSIGQHLVVALDPRTKTWGAVYPTPPTEVTKLGTYNVMAFDSARSELLIFANGSSTQHVVDVSNPASPSHRTVTVTGPAASTINDGLDQPAGCGVAYDPLSGNYVLHNGGSRIFTLTPGDGATWASAEVTPGGTPPASVANCRGTFTRWQYLPTASSAQHSLFCKVDDTNLQMQFYKSAVGGVQ